MADIKAYTDITLTTELTALNFNQLADGTTIDLDKSFVIGLLGSTGSYEADSSPGVDPIVLSIVDANSGQGIEATDLKLALSAAGLDSATAGDPLTLGLSIPAAGTLVYVRSSTPALASTNADITFSTNQLRAV